MNIPLKIRIWDKKRKRMIYLQEQIMITYNAHGKVKLVLGVPFHDDFQKGEIKDYDLMQFTGLKDKNEREIYEGDLIQLDNNSLLHVIEWSDDGYCMRIPNGTALAGIRNEACQVVSNIYENSNLLGSKQP